VAIIDPAREANGLPPRLFWPKRVFALWALQKVFLVQLNKGRIHDDAPFQFGEFLLE